jgi:hypothetical protein
MDAKTLFGGKVTLARHALNAASTTSNGTVLIKVSQLDFFVAAPIYKKCLVTAHSYHALAATVRIDSSSS